MAQVFGVGIIGMGWMGGVHSRSYRSIPDRFAGSGLIPKLVICAAARKAGTVTFVGYNYRWAPLVQYARKLVVEGKLGKLTHYHGRFLNGYAGDPLGFLSWRFEQAQGLGTLGDLMSHAIDMAHMMAGPIESLAADQEIFIKRRPIQQPGSGPHYDKGRSDGAMEYVTDEGYASALVHFQNGARGLL